MAGPSYLVVGLGNPGPDYALTRHNIGFMALDALAEVAHPSVWQKKFKGQAAQARLGEVDLLLLRPLTFMNLSGDAVGDAARFFKIPPERVIVLHDDIDLLQARVKVKQGGGNGGHNGLKSIDAALGPNYWRVRLGVGRPEGRAEVTNYVLGRFAKADAAWLEPLLQDVATHFPLLLAGKSADFLARLARAETVRAGVHGEKKGAL